MRLLSCLPFCSHLLLLYSSGRGLTWSFVLCGWKATEAMFPSSIFTLHLKHILAQAMCSQLLAPCPAPHTCAHTYFFPDFQFQS